MSISFNEYADGVRDNAVHALADNPTYELLLQGISDAFDAFLEYVGSGHEGVALFAAMAHASFLASVNLAAGGALPPSFMVARGVTEAALYGHYLFYHPELKNTWSAQHESEESKAKVRKEFTIRKMKEFLDTKSHPLSEQFGVVYGTTIDLGAHPNSLGTFSHLVEHPDGGYIWQYINTGSVDQRFAFRVIGMAGIFALNIFQELFPVHFASTGAGALLTEAHDRIIALPDPSASGG